MLLLHTVVGQVSQLVPLEVLCSVLVQGKANVPRVKQHQVGLGASDYHEDTHVELPSFNQ